MNGNSVAVVPKVRVTVTEGAVLMTMTIIMNHLKNILRNLSNSSIQKEFARIHDHNCSLNQKVILRMFESPVVSLCKI